jgi:NADH dehydrogenase FAD-containing subunit
MMVFFVCFHRLLSLIFRALFWLVDRCERPTMKARGRRKRIAIVGGGFAGTLAAHRISSNPHVDVLLIVGSDHFEFKPGHVHLLSSNPIGQSQFNFDTDLRLAMPRVQIIRARVTSVCQRRSLVCIEKSDHDESEKSEHLGRREHSHRDEHEKSEHRHRDELKYDRLIVATGMHSRYVYDGAESLCDGARERYTRLAERARVVLSSDDDDDSKVLVIGGGLVAVEVAAELAHMGAGRGRVLLACRGDALLDGGRAPPMLSRHVAGELRALGVDVRLGCTVRALGDGRHRRWLVDGAAETVGLALSCIGSEPNTEWLPSSLLDERGFVRVDEHLRALGATALGNVYACGDCIDTDAEKLAQNAETHAMVCAQNVLASLDDDNKTLPGRYVSASRPMLISLGETRAIFHYGRLWTRARVWPALLKQAIAFKVLFFRRII